MTDPAQPRFFTLSQDDGHAFDALFEQPRTPESTPDSPSGSSAASIPEGTALGGVGTAQGHLAHHGSDADQSTPIQPHRVAKVQQVMSLLGHYQAPSPSDQLLAITLEKIRHAQQRDRFAQQIQTLSKPTLALRGSDLFAVAASLLILASLALPMLSRHRSSARQMACASQNQSAGLALGSYASDYAGYLPRGVPGKSWYRLVPMPAGQTGQSNSRHFYLLIKHNYISPENLSCPENRFAQTFFAQGAFDWVNPNQLSYSFANQFTVKKQRLADVPSKAILADRNPLFVTEGEAGETGGVGGTGGSGALGSSQGLSVDQRLLSIMRNSMMHQSRGQNVLTAQGNVLWLKIPVMSNGDKIWAIGDQQRYLGHEAPSQMRDAHLVQ